MLKEGSTYAGLEEGFTPVSDADVAAEAYAKRLVEYDRNSAARTTVIDDQSDYYEIEGSKWVSQEVGIYSVSIGKLHCVFVSPIDLIYVGCFTLRRKSC